MRYFSRLISCVFISALALFAATSFAQSNKPVSPALYEGVDREQRLTQGARVENALTVYTSLTVEDITELAAAFEKKYAIKVKFWRASSEKIVQRIVTETRAGRFDFDVVETNGPELETLHREQLLQKAFSPHFADLIPQAILPHREWVGTRLNMFVQIYNTKLVKKEDFPKSYQDLLDPKWKGRLGIEAEDLDWFGTVVKDLGEEKGLKLFREIVATNGISVRKGKLEIIRVELQKLDQTLMGNIDLLRTEIEQEDRALVEARVAFKRAEAEYIATKKEFEFTGFKAFDGHVQFFRH